MAENLIFDEKEVAFLKELIRNGVPFMIVGLSAAALQGAPVVTQDVDLWFEDLEHPGIAAALKKVGGSYIPPVMQNPPMLAGDAVNLFDIVVHMHGLGSFREEARDAIQVPLGRFKLKVLGLERIIDSKRALGREKDKIVMNVLSDALIAIRSGQKK